MVSDQYRFVITFTPILQRKQIFLKFVDLIELVEETGFEALFIVLELVFFVGFVKY